MTSMPFDPKIRTDGLYFLKRNPLFGPMGEEVLSELAIKLKPIHLDKGLTLIHENDPGEALYLIQSGRIRILSRNEKGEEQPIAYLGRGDCIGELALLAGEPHTFTAVAEIASDFLVLARNDFDAILEAHPLVGIHISRALSRRLAVSFHPPPVRPKYPQVVTFALGLPHEAAMLVTINLAIALVEQTRKRILLLDLSPRSGDIAQALGLHSTLSKEATLHIDDLEDMATLTQWMTTHPSGLEILSLSPKILTPDLQSALPSFLSVLKDHYDFILALGIHEKNDLCRALLQESDKILFVQWDQAADVARATQKTLEENRGSAPCPMVHVLLQDPRALTTQRPDFIIPWMESYHQLLREKGSPYLDASYAQGAIAALDRLARALGKLRVGLAMGSGAAYGYSLIGMLKVFEREGIPVDLVSGTSMGALLGSFFCAGKSPLQIQDIARGITKRWLFENIFGDLTFPHSGFMAGQTLSGFLRSVLGHVEFHQLPIPFAAVATDIRSGHEVVIKEGRVADAVRASTSLPILFVPFLHKGRYLVDGGLVNPVPTSTVANMGADILISVNLTAKPSVRRGMGRFRHTFPLAPRSPHLTEVFFKMIYTMQYEIAQARTEIAHIVLAPDMRDFLWTDFHRSEEILKIGEASAEEAIPKLKSLLPFFSDYCKVPLGISLRAY